MPLFRIVSGAISSELALPFFRSRNFFAVRSTTHNVSDQFQLLMGSLVLIEQVIFLLSAVVEHFYSDECW